MAISKQIILHIIMLPNALTFAKQKKKTFFLLVQELIARITQAIS